MACVLDSLIFHKVGASSDKMLMSGKVYLNYLNRFIDIRIHKSPLFYYVWSFVNVPLCLKHFFRSTHSVINSFSLLRKLWCDAGRKDGVSREDFEALVLNNTYFTSK